MFVSQCESTRYLAFNQEKALVGALSVIVAMLGRAHQVRGAGRGAGHGAGLAAGT